MKEKAWFLCLILFSFFNTKLTCGSSECFFTATCHCRVIKRSHSCLKHSVCSAGQVSLQTNGRVWSRCFYPGRLLRLSCLRQSRCFARDRTIGCYATCQPNALAESHNERVAVYLELFSCSVFSFRVQAGSPQASELKLQLQHQSSPTLCLIENRPAPVGEGGCLFAPKRQLWTSAAPPLVGFSLTFAVLKVDFWVALPAAAALGTFCPFAAGWKCRRKVCKFLAHVVQTACVHTLSKT